MSDSLKSFIRFSRSERRGISVLVVLCLLSAAYNQFMPDYISNKQIDLFEREHQVVLSSLRGDPKVEKEQKSPAYNDSSTNDIERLSVSVQKEDRVVKEPVRNEYSETPATLSIKELRINSATAPQLIQTGLVSKKIAFRIIRYRESLGGFVRANQLKEVYELTDSIYSSISEMVILEATEVRRIKVNIDSADEMMEHPYIHKGLAGQIVNYRTKAGDYRDGSDLLKLYFMDESLLEQLRPYLDFKLQ
ncbi:MAG: hypothetical protein GY751_08235 [Bacteroidetes bacterium]|nr:hypothetical protein [Bacteroidota bacterium]